MGAGYMVALPRLSAQAAGARQNVGRASDWESGGAGMPPGNGLLHVDQPPSRAQCAQFETHLSSRDMGARDSRRLELVGALPSPLLATR